MNRTAIIIERREFGALTELVLGCAEVAAGAQPGHYLLLQAAAPTSLDPWLPRAIFIADAEPSLGQLRLLIAPRERGEQWLASQLVGTRLILSGPHGHALPNPTNARRHLFAGGGATLPALLFAARQAARRQAEVLLIAVGTSANLPPPFLLPATIEYQTVADEAGLLAALSGPNAPLSWADRCGFAAEPSAAAALANLVRSAKLRWEPGFASLLANVPIQCATSACGSCSLQTRHGERRACRHGPSFDLRDLA